MDKPLPRSGAGRPKGSKNKKNAVVQTAIALLAENNVGKMQDWLDTVAQDEPLEALKIMLAVMEYNLPKLARVESTTQLKGALPAITVNFVKPE